MVVDFGELEKHGTFVDLRLSFGDKRKRTSTSQRRVQREERVLLGPSADGVYRRTHRVFKRDVDFYEERVTDEAMGQLVRLLVEPLSCHVARGTAKRNTCMTVVEWALGTMASETL